MPRGTTARRSPGALRVAAALLLVDGRFLSAGDLAALARPWSGPLGVVRVWVQALRAAGLEIETGPPPRYGYRLAALPPDELLDDVLVMARHLMGEEPTRLWHLFGRPARPAPVTVTRPSQIPRSA